LSQGWIANDIQIGEAGQAESIAEAAPSGALDIEENLGGGCQFVS